MELKLNPRIRRLGIACAVAALGGVTLVSIVFPKPKAAAVPSYGASVDQEPTSTPSGVPDMDEPTYYNEGAGSDAHRRTYAIPLVDLSGLSADASPGTVFEMWVAWDPTITEGPRIELLLAKVRLEEIVAPPVAEGPFMALISVKRNQVGDLIWGSTFGELSVVTIP